MKQALGREDAVELKANWSTARREVTAEAAEVCKAHEAQARVQGQGPASQTNLRCVLPSSPNSYQRARLLHKYSALRRTKKIVFAFKRLTNCCIIWGRM